MSTAHDPRSSSRSHDPDRSSGPDRSGGPEGPVVPDGEEARRLLAEAEGRSRMLPAAIPAAYITYGMLCVIGTFTVIGLHLAALVPETPGMAPTTLMIIFAVVWVMVSMVPLLLIRDRWRRGLGWRWIALMSVWGVLWVLGMILATTPAALIIAPMFFVLFVIAIAGEAAAGR